MKEQDEYDSRVKGKQKVEKSIAYRELLEQWIRLIE